MTRFTISSLVEDSENLAPPVLEEPSFSVYTPNDIVNQMMEAAADAAMDSYNFTILTENAFIECDNDTYYYIQENAVTTVWDRVKQFIQKIVDALKKLLNKAKEFFARMLGNTERWYNLIQERWQNAKSFRGAVTVKMPQYRIYDNNYDLILKKMKDQNTQILYVATEETGHTSYFFKIAGRKPPVNTIKDAVNYVTNAIKEYTEAKTKTGKVPDGFEEYIKTLQDSGNSYASTDSAVIEEHIASKLSPGSKTLKDALNVSKSALYDNEEAVEADYTMSQGQEYMDLIARGKGIAKELNAIIMTINTEFNLVKAKWAAQQSEFLSYANIMHKLNSEKTIPKIKLKDKGKIKRDHKIDTADFDVKRMAHAGASYISKYCGYITRMLSVTSRACTQQCNLFNKAFSGAQRDGMKLCSALINAAERDNAI